MFLVLLTHIPIINTTSPQLAGLTHGVRDSFLMKPTATAELGPLFLIRS